MCLQPMDEIRQTMEMIYSQQCITNCSRLLKVVIPQRFVFPKELTELVVKPIIIFCEQSIVKDIGVLNHLFHAQSSIFVCVSL